MRIMREKLHLYISECTCCSNFPQFYYNVPWMPWLWFWSLPGYPRRMADHHHQTYWYIPPPHYCSLVTMTAAHSSSLLRKREGRDYYIGTYYLHYYFSTSLLYSHFIFAGHLSLISVPTLCCSAGCFDGWYDEKSKMKNEKSIRKISKMK